MKMALRSLDKEGQAAAGCCCRGGSKAVRVSELQRWGNHPRRASPSIPSSVEEGSLFSGGDNRDF